MRTGRKTGISVLVALLWAGSPALGQAPAPVWSPAPPPKLLVVISVDQFSADLFNEYRSTFTDGMARLTHGVVFPKAYQSHAATETCPGHSTILTGNRPGHTGIIANSWFDQSVARDEKLVYCAEDPAAPGATAQDYVASPIRLKVPTLGERMKRAHPDAKVISVAGKDRAAIMMGGPTADQLWWWGDKGFTSYRGIAITPLVERVNAGIAPLLNTDRPAMESPQSCAAKDRVVQLSAKTSIGAGRFARKAGDMRAFRASPAFDAAVLVLAASLIDQQKLGQGASTDIISIGLSANDYIGHTYGTGGLETCIEMASLDRELGVFFDRLDASGVDYLVTLTADHGGNDAPERERENGAPDAQRVSKALSPKAVNAALAQKTGLTGELILADGPFGDIYVNNRLNPREHAAVLDAARSYYGAQPQVQTVFTHAELIAAPEPSGPPESWTLLQEAKASFDPERSGDLVVLLKPRVTPIIDPDGGYVATHGSPWDYDRRVPLLFWRAGMAPFEQPLGVETVDIMPTLASQIDLVLPATGYDGRCLDLVAGAQTSCPAR